MRDSQYLPPGIRQHTSAFVSIRPHTSAYVSIRQHTSAYVSIRQHSSAYVSIRQHTSADAAEAMRDSQYLPPAYVSIRQHTSADTSGGDARLAVPATISYIDIPTLFSFQCSAVVVWWSGAAVVVWEY